MATTTATQVQQLYVGLLGRAADQGGLNWWVDQVNTGGRTLEDIRASFVTSTEYTTGYGAATSRTALVEAIYQNLFERTPTADEVQYWAVTDTRPADQLVAAFLEFASANDQKTIDNKVFVAQTYTDTVGDAGFNADAAVTVIADVDGTPASVSAAIGAIANGTLAGQVPGVTAINTLATAQAAVTTFEAANKVTADALVAKLAAHVDTAGLPVDSDTDDIDAANSSYQEKMDAVVADAQTFRGNVDERTTTVLTTDASDKAGLLTTAYTALNAGSKPLADKLVAAIAAEATAKTGAATDFDKASVEAGLETASPTHFGVAADYVSADALYTAYVTGSVSDRTAIDASFEDSTYYSNTFKATVVKDAAYADALKATAAATDALDSNETATVITTKVNGVTIIADADDSIGTGNAYISALTAKTAADVLLASAIAADADVTAAQTLSDAYDVQTGAVETAEEAVAAVNVAGKVAVHALAGNTDGTGTVAAPIKDIFYFADKAIAGDTDTNFTIGSFAAGDSIVLGNNSYTYNSGALTTGDNNKLEFFLVKSTAGLQIVLETENYGSSDVKTDATSGAVINPTADHAAVITLTGVAAADVTVANGIISHVA